MSESSEDSPSPVFTIEDLMVQAEKGAPYLLTGPKKGTFKKKSAGNLHERFPEEFRDRFRNKYHPDFRRNFQQQAELEFKEAYPLEREKTSSTEETSRLASTPSIETIPDPVSYTPSPKGTPGPVNTSRPVKAFGPVNTPYGYLLSAPSPVNTPNPVRFVRAPIKRPDPWIGGRVSQREQGFGDVHRDGQFPESVWRGFDEYHPGGFFDPIPINQFQGASQDITNDEFENCIAQYGDVSGEIIMDWSMELDEYDNQLSHCDEGYSELPDLSYREIDSRNEESYQNAVEYLSPMQETGEVRIDGCIDPSLDNTVITISDDDDDAINQVLQQTSYDSHIYRVVQRAIKIFLQREHDLTSRPREEGSLTDFEMASPERSEGEEQFPDQQAASKISKLIAKKLLDSTRRGPQTLIHQTKYLTGKVQSLDQPNANNPQIDASDDGGDDERSDTSPPIRKIVTLKVNPRWLRTGKKSFRVTFQRIINYRQEIRKMQRDGRFKDGDEVRLIKMEVMFTELQELINDIWKRMMATLVLHDDLFHGVVGFSRWSVEGRCLDVEIFDMLMSFNRINQACKNNQVSLTLLDIVQEHTAPEKRIDCHKFSSQIFPLPIKFLTAAQVCVADSHASSSSDSSDEDETVNRPDPPKTAALSFMGKVAIRFNRSTGEFCFSGLYHLVKFEGRARGSIDFYKHQKDGSPFAPGSGGTSSSLRYQRYSGSWARSRLRHQREN
ncbi:uncharacterized protein DFL_009463 [Arthrobotrys flagrans]|uniref:Uncharacterized protein n=1 Tax=Arthrobotrys flagrans TaxID=97331 RepID=A0A436ZS78_ARTFL|nr:hypothetical protein DFL_009463 [Arthrobotrys flagrans]